MGNKFWLDFCWIYGVCCGVIDYKQYVVGLFNFLLCVFDINMFYFVIGFMQFGGIDDMQWYFVNVDMFMQYVMCSFGDIGYDCCFMFCQCV